jgi:lantibiotic transport system permease protein
VLIGLKTKGSVPLDRYWQTGAAFWAFAMLPMSVTALSVLMAQMEHGPRTWDHILALPGARRRVFLAKAIVMLALVAAMTLLVGLMLVGGAELLAAVKPLATKLDQAALAETLWKMFLASGLMCVIQLWTALAFRSFVPPLLLGIMGTFVSVAAAAAREGAYFPWLMPLHILSTDLAMQRVALEIGAFGGLVGLGLMLLHLQHREAV